MNIKRYNCSNTLDYGHELQRMCSSINDCWMCPIHHDSGVCKSKISSESISAVQNWSDTHPETDECFEIRKPRKLTDEDENSIREIFYKVLDDAFKMLFPHTDIIKSDYICELMEAENNLINQINSSIAHELFFSE